MEEQTYIVLYKTADGVAMDFNRFGCSRSRGNEKRIKTREKQYCSIGFIRADLERGGVVTVELWPTDPEGNYLQSCPSWRISLQDLLAA